ncbi:MAG: helix-turn-helix domain-containing protein [Pseudomonadota bacterium]
MVDHIQQAAIELYARHGSDFTLLQLERATGLSRATLYRRIGSKDALISQMAEQHLIRLDDGRDLDTRVISAARSVVAEHGFLACTMEQIAGKAGIGIATLYRHFKDKETLLTRIAQPERKPVVRRTLEASTPDFERNLRQVVDVALRVGSENRDIAAIVFSSKPAEKRYLGMHQQDAAKAYSRLVRFLQESQQNGLLHANMKADDLAMQLQGLIIQYSVFGPAYLCRPLDVDADAQTIVRTFMRVANG